MIDLQPAPVPVLSEEWIAAHRTVVLSACTEGRPGRSGPVRWAALAGATVCAAVSAVAITVMLGAGTAPSAFAGWSPSPTSPATGQLAAADSTCQSALAGLPATNKGSGSASLAPELSDVRGPFTVTVFGNAAHDEALCMSSADATSLRWISPSDAPVAPDAIAVDHVSFLARDGQQYTLVVGRTGSGVNGVALNLDDGSAVTTTSGNGLFVAWWPGGQGITTATVDTAGGTSSQSIDVTGPGNAPADKTTPPPPGQDPSVGPNVCAEDCS